ncbi:MAG: alpha/beta family hydrolase, partial [Bacteroidota bacterium]
MKVQSGKFEVSEERGSVSFLSLSPLSARAILGLAHGAGAGMDHQNMEAIAQAMASVGIATLRYNFSYMEMGKGRESSQVSIATVKKAAIFASQHFADLPLLMGGHSYGGRMSTLAAAEGFSTPVEGLILFNFPLHAPGKPSLDRAAHLKNISVPSLF